MGKENEIEFDFFGKNASELKNKKLFLFDMDGTIYEENNVFNGTHQLLDYIAESGGKYVFITNNSSKSVNDYITKVNGLGIKADILDFFIARQQARIQIAATIYTQARLRTSLFCFLLYQLSLWVG